MTPDDLMGLDIPEPIPVRLSEYGRQKLPRLLNDSALARNLIKVGWGRRHNEGHAQVLVRIMRSGNQYWETFPRAFWKVAE